MTPRGQKGRRASSRRTVALLCVSVGCLSLAASSARAQSFPGVPIQQDAAAAPAQSPPSDGQVHEAPYDPAQHHGWSEGSWLRATRGTMRRSTGMMATGITLVSLGAVLLATGGGVAAASHCGSVVSIDNNGNTQMFCGATTGPTVGTALMLAGIAGLSLGIPLTALGASEVPRYEAGGSASPPPPRATLLLGLRSAAIGLKF